MLRTGWTERLLAAVAVLLLAGCSLVPGGSPTGGEKPGAEPGRNPGGSQGADDVSPAFIGRYESVIARLPAGHDPAAVAELEALHAARPDLAGPLFNLALVEARAGDDVAAADLLEQALAVCSRCAPVWTELGVIHRESGRFAEAEAAYRQAVELEPDYALAQLNLAIYLELYGQQPDLALDAYRRYLELDPTGDAHTQVTTWVAGLERRTVGTPQAARSESRP